MLHRFERRVSNTISTRGLLKPGQQVILAVSGGADSVAMLRSLFAIQKGSGLTCVTVNHHIHDEAEKHTMFVEELCGTLKIPCFVEHVDVKGRMAQEGLSMEHSAREERYRVLQRISNGNLIATAHTQNDQSETVLINLLRGTGPKGTCGIPSQRGNIIRPLIEQSREDVVDYLDDINQDYVTDPTNLEDDALRNRIRHNLLPLLKEISGSNPIACLSRFSESMEMNEAALSFFVDRTYSEMVTQKGVSISVKDLLCLPLGVRMGLFRKMAEAIYDLSCPSMGQLMEVNKLLESAQCKGFHETTVCKFVKKHGMMHAEGRGKRGLE